MVVPRERFTSLPVSLRSLFSTIAEEVPVIVVEGGMPEATRVELHALSQELVALSRPRLAPPEIAGAGILLERT